MSETCLFDDEKMAHAVDAAKKAARRAGVAANEATVLYRSRRVVLLFPEIATVARVGSADEACLAADARELSVARRLVLKGAPVVGPSEFMAPKPFIEDGLAVTFWPNVDHKTCDYEDREAVACAALALRRVHQCLTDYPGALPSYWERIERCASSLRGPKPPAALGAEDRTFLLKTYDRLCEALQRFDVRAAPIHGDAHMGNAFFTPAGPLWTDFETACLGPHEWDVAAISHPAAFSGLDPDLYAILSQLRSLCVVVWCAALAHDPKKRAVGEEQLALLKSAAARRGVGAEVGRS